MTTKIIASVGLAMLLTAITTTAEARRHEKPATYAPIYDQHGAHGYAAVQTLRERPQARTHRHLRSIPKPTGYPERRVARVGTSETQLLPHPAGCPARLFCGCGAAVEVFGRPIRELWLAANWFKFPPAEPAPGMVAVRRHHVFVIREVLGPGLVLAYDANSGRRQTRLHVRRLAGYSVRNPRGSRYAALR